MVSFASTSWNKCVGIPFVSTLAIIKNRKRMIILKSSSTSSRKRICWSAQILWMELLSFVQICVQECTAYKPIRSVGVDVNRNCREIEYCDRVTKKNTPTANRSVLDFVCYYEKGSLINPIVARIANLFNLFARCYG
jgi:hypothetical protein